MVALIRAYGLFHFAQDGVHLGSAQLLVGAHGGVAGEHSIHQFEQFANLSVEFVQIGVYGFPDDFQINFEIAMRDAIAHGVDD